MLLGLFLGFGRCFHLFGELFDARTLRKQPSSFGNRLAGRWVFHLIGESVRWLLHFQIASQKEIRVIIGHYVLGEIQRIEVCSLVI